MFRLLGFLIGSASSIVVLLLVLGMPDFHFGDVADDDQRFEVAVEKLKEKQQEIAAAADVIVEDLTTAVTDERNDTAPLAEAAPLGEPSPLPPQPDAEAETGLAPPPDPVELQWYSFWNPFRSEIAAGGFVSQLEKVTGLDYRVVKVKTGVYEVAFAYADDAERQHKLTQIALATGLDLPGT